MPTITHTGRITDAEPATERQLAFVRRLAVEKIFPRLGADRAARVARLEELIVDITKSRMTRLIGDLVIAPIDRTPIADDITIEKLTAGVYERNGEIFSVKWNRAKTNLYAQRLVEINGERLTESGDVVSIEFDYAPGAVKTLRPHHKMSIDRARELTIRYGRCLACGRHLKNAESVERGIGPVCRKSFTS